MELETEIKTADVHIEKDPRLVILVTKEEQGVLLNFIDAVVRSHGLEAAEAALVLAKRIREAEPEDV